MAYRYPTVKVDGKTKQKHRHVVEQHLGRRLRRNETVHHKDGEPHRCDIDNLEVMSAKKHRQHHADERLVYPRTKHCEICGVRYTPHATKRKRQRTCSPDCAYRLRSANCRTTKRQKKANLALPAIAAAGAAD